MKARPSGQNAPVTCTSTCLDSSPRVDAVLEEQVIKENLRTRLMNMETTYPEQKEGKPNPQQGQKVQWNLRSTSASRTIRHSKPEKVQLMRLTERSRTPNRGSERAAGHDLFSIETTTVPAKEQRMIGTGIAIALLPGTYARIAPRSGLAFKHGITTNAGVIDADYRGEVKVLLVNLKETDYEVKEGDRIAQIIIERIYDKNFKEVKHLNDTERSTSGFGSTEQKEQERKREPDIEFNSAQAFGKMYKRGDRTGIFNLRMAEKGATCAATTISTELAIKAGKGGDKISVRTLHGHNKVSYKN